MGVNSPHFKLKGDSKMRNKLLEFSDNINPIHKENIINSFNTFCNGKQRFENIKLAKDIVKKQQRRRDLKFNIYKCDWCGGYHIGTESIKRNHIEEDKRVNDKFIKKHLNDYLEYNI